jgi:FtsZ-binding cell division protein ZapB
MAVPIGVSAKNITLIDAQTGEQKVFWINDTDENLPENLTVQIIHTLEVQGNKTIIAYDGNMVRAYNSYIYQLKQNISKLQNELDNKNKLLAEYITYKKKNIKLQQNISKLNNQITTLKAENEIIKQQNEQYKDLITDLMAKTSNQTIENTKDIYEKDKKLIGGFTWSFTIGLVSVGVIAYSLMRLKQKYEDL